VSSETFVEIELETNRRSEMDTLQGVLNSTIKCHALDPNIELSFVPAVRFSHGGHPVDPCKIVDYIWFINAEVLSKDRVP
jgi:hypothetical protein